MSNPVRPGLTAARYLRAMVVSKGDPMQAVGFIDRHNWLFAGHMKAAVDAMSTANTSELASQVGADFVKLVYPQTILGRLRALRRIPLNMRSIRQTAGGRAYWVKELNPKPMTALAFDSDPAMEPRKVVGLTVITEELARMAEAEEQILRDLGDAATAALDSSFIDPGNAGVSDEEPASVTNGATVIPSSGTDADAVRTDMQELFGAFEGDLRTAAFVMHPRTAFSLSLMQAALGGAEFDIAAGTGTLFSMPVILSSSVPRDTSGSPIVLLDANGIEVGGTGEAKLRTSTEASILMNDMPSPGSQMLVSMWQTDSVALLGEININWRRVRSGAVATLSGANYGV